MLKVNRFARLTNQIYENTESDHVTQLCLENKEIDGRIIEIEGKKAIHFGNVSYVGLDTDARLKASATAAIQQYGVQFSSSRSFLSVPLYQELEENLRKMYGRPTIVTPSTTLGHFAAMPLFILPEDTVLIDYQAHASLQLAIETVRATGTTVEKLPHGNMNILEDRIKAAAHKKGNIWYVADGVYSMFGDLCDMDALNTLLAKYPNLFAYLDDAHGISWTGKYGTGAVADHIVHHDRTLLAISLNKGIAAGGGAIVCPDETTSTYLKRAGASLVFSGPVQPSALAAATRSTAIHLNDEIKERQGKVLENIHYFKQKAKENNLILGDKSNSPVFLIGIGRVDTGVRICRMLREAGYYTNIGGFPAVPVNQTGLRVSIHYHLEKSDIDNLCRVLAELIPMELKKDNYPIEKVVNAFHPSI